MKPLNFSSNRACSDQHDMISEFKTKKFPSLSICCSARSIIMPDSVPSPEIVSADVAIREVLSIEEYDACISLQREVFGLPDLEISPRRHLIVSREAGGWTLAAFNQGRIVGFVHQLAAARGDEIFGYSHMMAVAADFQNLGVGAKLKWAQRARALAEGRDFIKWTFEPMRGRNAHFNLNRLGVIEIPADFPALLKSDPDTAKREQLRVRQEFLALLSEGFVCRAFDRNAARPKYLFYRSSGTDFSL